MSAEPLRPPRPAGPAGTGLLLPSLQAEPLPLREVAPSPCTLACPAGVNVKSYVSLIADGRFAEALEEVRRHCPLPGICGRICHHPCEAACRRSEFDEPVAIRALKRFIADIEEEAPAIEPRPVVARSRRVAVVGSGPAGLTAAYDLRMAGYPVTVFEAEPEPGGMLRYGITPFRLPRPVLDAEIEYLCRAGIRIRTGRRIGVDLELEKLLAGGYAAVLFAVGAQRGRVLGLEGEEDLDQVEDALAFLRRFNRGETAHPGHRVVVIGGGSTAVEAARSALRAGAEEVEILYRRHREEMPAGDEEIEAARAEGIKIRFLIAPSRLVVEGGRLRGLECLRVALGEPDASGRRRPVTLPGTEFLVPADRILAAVGQQVDLDFLPGHVAPRLSERGRLRIDATTAATALHGVFAAGDAVSGPATVIEAVAAGHRAAQSMRRFLESGVAELPRESGTEAARPEYELPDPPPLPQARRHPERVELAPGRELWESEAAFTVPEALAEARRCLRCGPCSECRVCVPTCGRRHVLMRLSEDGGPGPALLLRTSAAVARALHADGAGSGRLLGRAVPSWWSRVPEAPIEALPVTVRIRGELCRGCARCIDVCSFDAIRLRQEGEAEPWAELDPALCRGCALCATVCPTGAASPAAFSDGWWRDRLERLAARAASGERPWVVLSCRRRLGDLAALDRGRRRVEMIRFPCLGGVGAGMLLELCRLPIAGVLAAGCLQDRCRYELGGRLAAGEVARAQSILRLLGRTGPSIQADWSGDAAADPLQPALLELLAGRPERPRRRRRAARGGA